MGEKMKYFLWNLKFLMGFGNNSSKSRDKEILELVKGIKKDFYISDNGSLSRVRGNDEQFDEHLDRINAVLKKEDNKKESE